MATIVTRAGKGSPLTNTEMDSNLTTLSTSIFNGTSNVAVNSSNGAATITTAGTTAVTVDTSQNVGVGVTPSAWTTFTALQVKNAALMGLNTETHLGGNVYYSTGYKYSSNGFATRYSMNDVAGGAHAWFTSATGTAGNAVTFTQAMTLDASGNLLVGTNSPLQSSNPGAKILNGGNMYLVAPTSAGDGLSYYNSTAGAYRFYVNNAGTINATNTTISAISDIRFKENVRDLDVGLDKIMELKPRLYDWKEGKGADIKNARGFIAQEFETVFPDLIDEWRDPSPEGEEPYKSVRQDLIPVLVKAIQEQQALITQLQADVTALKAK